MESILLLLADDDYLKSFDEIIHFEIYVDVFKMKLQMINFTGSFYKCTRMCVTTAIRSFL